LDLDTVIEYADMDFIIYTIISMQNGIRYNLVYRFRWVRHPLKPLSPQNRNNINSPYCRFHSFVNKFVCGAFYCNRITNQCVTRPFL